MVRVKKRYLAFKLERPRDLQKIKVPPPLKVCEGSLFNRLKELLLKFFGDHGLASAVNGLRVVYLNKDTGVALVCARHGPHRLLAAVLPFLVAAGEEEELVPRLVFTGATIRNCYKVLEAFQTKELRAFVEKAKKNRKQLKESDADELDSRLNALKDLGVVAK